MSETIFLAGATGAIGRRLLPLLVESGYSVYGATRKAEHAQAIRDAGANPILVDVFDADALKQALIQAGPSIVIHQLTDLPFGLEPEQMEEGRKRNAHLREVGTKNLVDAAVAAGAKRMISQSIAFSYQPGPGPRTEDMLLQESAAAILTLEALTLHTAGLSGIVLRNGLFYGEGTGSDAPTGPITLHVADAARAALLATKSKVQGIFNIVEDGGPVSNAKAKSILGWYPATH